MKKLNISFHISKKTALRIAAAVTTALCVVFLGYTYAFISATLEHLAGGTVRGTIGEVKVTQINEALLNSLTSTLVAESEEIPVAPAGRNPFTEPSATAIPTRTTETAPANAGTTTQPDNGAAASEPAAPPQIAPWTTL